MKRTPYQEALFEFHRRATNAVRTLGDQLRDRQLETDLDPSAPESVEVRFGLASRQWRLLWYITSDIALWSDERSSSVMRGMTDTRILAAWLIHKNDPELYRKFVEFGRGRLKLYKLHYEQAVDEDGLQEDMDEYLSSLEEQVNAEVLEEFQTINIGANFAGVPIRTMADEAGLKRMYDLMYQRLSGEGHGQWDALLEHDLAPSGDPLLHGHRFGVYSTASEQTSLRVVGLAFMLAADAVYEIFEDLGIDVATELDTCRTELSAALADAKGQLEGE